MKEVLINHPYFGSVWLSNAYIENGYVIGDADDWQNSPYLPEGRWNIPCTLNFPISCIRKASPDILEILKEVKK